MQGGIKKKNAIHNEKSIEVQCLGQLTNRNISIGNTNYQQKWRNVWNVLSKPGKPL
jgi:hypothetical protein